MSLADRSTKKQKVKILPISGHDPESQRSEMIKVRLETGMLQSLSQICYKMVIVEYVRIIQSWEL